jgi:selenophosphate synthetase-related protein
MTSATSRAAVAGATEAGDALRLLASGLRENPSLRAKAAISLVSEVFGPSDWLRGPGDDGAAVTVDGSTVIACGEAIWPRFVQHDPYGAGIAAVLANVNDLAAMGATPLGIVDTVVAERQVARSVLEGMRYACELYDVPLLGGHLTEHSGEPAVSAFGLGQAGRPLSVAAAAAGHRLVVACATEGEMRGDFPFFRSFGHREDRTAEDVRLLHQVAAAGDCVAAKDISMAGLVGSLAMLLEHGRLGITLDLDLLPRPPEVPLELWLRCFPSYGFLLCVPDGREDAAVRPFLDRGLQAATVGVLDDTGLLRLQHGDELAVVLDLTRDVVTGLRAQPADNSRP